MGKIVRSDSKSNFPSTPNTPGGRSYMSSERRSFAEQVLLTQISEPPRGSDRQSATGILVAEMPISGRRKYRRGSYTSSVSASSLVLAQEKSCFGSNAWNIVGMGIEFFIALSTNAFFYAQFLQTVSCGESGEYLGYTLTFGLSGLLLGLWSTTSVLCHYILNKHEQNPDLPIVPRYTDLANAYPITASFIISFLTLGDYLGHIADVVSGFLLWAAFVGLDLTLCDLQAPLAIGLTFIAALTSVANVRTCLGHLVMESGSRAWINWMLQVEGDSSRCRTFISCLKSEWWTLLCLIAETLIAVLAYSSLYANVFATLACFGSDVELGSGPYWGYELWQLVLGAALGLYSSSFAYSCSRVNSQSKDIAEFKIEGFNNSTSSPRAQSESFYERLSEDDTPHDDSQSSMTLSCWRKIILVGSVGGAVGDLASGLSSILLKLLAGGSKNDLTKSLGLLTNSVSFKLLHDANSSDLLPCWARSALMLGLLSTGLMGAVANLWTCYGALLMDEKKASENSGEGNKSSCCCVWRAAPSAQPSNDNSFMRRINDQL